MITGIIATLRGEIGRSLAGPSGRFRVARRDSQAATLRAQRGHLDPQALLENWDETANVTFDRALWSEIASLRFLDSHHHVLIVGPVGVGKTFLAHAIGHIACRRGHTVLALPADKALKTLRHARLTNAYEVELRKMLAVDLLVLDDFCLDQMDAQESRDAYEILTERHRSGSVIVTSNRGPDEWLAAFADPLRAQSAIDRFVNNAYDLVMEGESNGRRTCFEGQISLRTSRHTDGDPGGNASEKQGSHPPENRHLNVNFGVGRMQPHSASEVLSNRYGDCKDKLTLLLLGTAALAPQLGVGRTRDPRRAVGPAEAGTEALT